MKQSAKRRPGGQSGNKNAAKPADERRVVINLAVARKTRETMREISEKRRMSMGRVVDAAVAAFRDLGA